MGRIKCCRVCNSENIVEFLNLGEQPLANSLLRNLNEKEEFYPLSLSWCSNCSLVQLNHTVEPKDLFSEYVWVTATSKAAKEHAETFCRDVLSRTNDLGKGLVLEVASNDGTFLKPFIENDCRVLGVDPAKNIVDIAVANGIPTECRFFGVEAAEEIIEEFGQARVVIARNVVPHVANLNDFVAGLNRCLEEDGLLVVEFHYARVIHEELHYDSIYHEHLGYFTLKSMEELLAQHNLFVTEIKESPISGGSLILYIKKKRGQELPVVQSYRDSENKTGVNELGSWQGFAQRVDFHREQLLAILGDINKKAGPIVGYGASARSSTLLNFCGIDRQFVSIIADQNPLKHKHYTAGTHILIASPETVMKEKPEYVLILAWNFFDEIVSILRHNFDFTGKCITPLPVSPRVVDVG